MKTLKSLLAIFMVLVIGVCLTGCQSAEEIAESERLVSESVSESERAVSESVSAMEAEKEENAEFKSWFNEITFAADGIRLGFSDKAKTELAVNFDDAFGEGVEVKYTTDDEGNNNVHMILPDILSAAIVYNGNVSFLSKQFYSVTADFILSSDSTLSDLIIKGIFIDYPEYSNGDDIEQISIRVKDNNGEEVTLTYNPKAE
ncbi:MAG: hypothetical protein LBL87_01695 [Ruminococcus sp.]|jgi:uncharacterized protein YcfL|nr:hypothetical protein [Ruminococcus sp.]